MMGQPQEHAQRAIDAGRVVVAVDAVYIGGQRARRRGLRGVLILSGRCAGNQIDQTLVIPVMWQGHVQDVARAQFRIHVRLVGLQHGGACFYCDGLIELPDLQGHVFTTYNVDGDRDVPPRETAETIPRR